MGQRSTQLQCINVFLVSVAAPPTSNTEDHSHSKKDSVASKGDDVLLNVIRPDYERPPAPPPMEPIFGLTDDGKVGSKYLLTWL